MDLHVIGSGSSGNGYFLKPSSGKGLLIECGVLFKDIKKALNFNISQISGCIASHEHGDHFKSANDLIKSGIKVYTSKGTAEALNVNCEIVKHGKNKQIGDFTIQPFNVNHDAAEPIGFLIFHPETGLILFATDTNELKYKIPNIQHWIIEANYSEELMLSTIVDDKINTYLAGRICQNHMSLETTIQVLKNNDLSKVKSITLIHLSKSNGSGKIFTEQIKRQIGIVPNIAAKGKVFNL